LLAIALLLAPVTAQAANSSGQSQAELKEAYELISRFHVSGKQLDLSSYSSIDEMIASLDDPYTEFFDEDEMQQFMNAIDLNYAGIGMRIAQDDGGYIVVETFQNSPAREAGLQSGDYIVAINGTKTEHLALHEVSYGVRGPEGTPVFLTVNRDGQLFEVKIVRKMINLPEVESGILDGRIGYLSLSSFSGDADEHFAFILKDFKEIGIKGLVIDLRDNGGGLLETAQQIAKQFIPEGVLIHVKDRYKEGEVTIANGTSVEFPVVVLVNGNSASASEVLAGALQDYGKAKIVGQKTYGKGSVQVLYPMNTGGVLKLTVQEYYTPQKKPVDHVGIEPDVEVEGVIAQLIYAAREAGLQDFRLELKKHSYLLNGIEFYDDTPLRQIDGSHYVQARALAALVNAPVSWNESLHGLEIGSDDSVHTFTQENGLMIVNGTGYIELQAFLGAFPQLEADITDGGVVLALKGSAQ
jgi:carboxyl-terminal processing protease